MTWVSTSRSFAYLEIVSSWRSDSHRLISATCASRNRASCTASSVDLQTKQDALVIRSWSTYVRKPPDSAAARAPAYRDAARAARGEPPLRVRERNEHLVGGAAGLGDAAEGLFELVFAELDLQGADDRN